jgi:hypothetical protein
LKRRILSVLAFAAFAAADAGAELSIEGLSWQRARVERGRAVVWEEVPVLSDEPPKLDARLRVRLTLKNRGPKPAEGVLIRYSMTGRIKPIAGEAADGSWGVPFSVDERRVPKVGANKIQDVLLTTSPALELYLNKLGRSGWWADRVKIQAMIEPHQGVVSVQSLETVLEVSR